MKKRIVSLVLVASLLLTSLPLGALTALAQDALLYGDADGNGKVELLDVNLMERYIEGQEDAKEALHPLEADVNGDGVVDEADVEKVKGYLAGNLTSLTPKLHTLTFVTDGGGDIGPIQAGDGLPYRGTIPTPTRDDALFSHWAMEDGRTYYPMSEPVTGDMTLTAVYEPLASSEQLTLTSFSLTDQEPDVSFTLTGPVAGAGAVKDAITLLPKDGSDPVAYEVTDNGDGTYTVYAPEGFTPGASYELTLGDGLFFQGRDETFRTAYFIIAKDEADNLQYNADMIFLQDTPEMTYDIGGETVDVLQSALLSNDEGVDAITGSFTLTTQDLSVGDTVCIYETTDPRDRDYTQDDYQDDAMAFIRITGIEGDTYQFESLDEDSAEDVLAMPDSIPIQVSQLPTGNGSVQTGDYDSYALSLMGETEAPEFAVDDFLTFYTVPFDQVDESTPAAYGQITRVEGGTAYYKLITKQDIEDFMGLFLSQTVDSETIAENLDESLVKQQVEQQAMDSGFAQAAAGNLVETALETEAVQQQLLDAGFSQADIQQMRAAPAATLAAGGGGGAVKFAMEDLNVGADVFYDRHYKDGFGVELEIGVVFSVSKKVSSTSTTSLKIQLTAAMEQEAALHFDVNVEDKWKWYFIIPVLKELNVTTAIDIEDYTYLSVGAKTYTVSSDPSATKKWKALSETVTGPNASPQVRSAILNLNKLAAKAKKMRAKGEDVKDVLAQIESYKNMIPGIEIDGQVYSLEELEEDLKGQDVSGAFDEVFNAQSETESKTGMEQLMDRYRAMLEQDCDWVKLFDQPIASTSFYLAIVNIRLDTNFVVSANVNMALGADLEYQVGKRYTFWLHLLDGTSGSSEMDLIDERFGFQFYVMGTLGLKMGIKAEVAFGLLSTSLASVGANVEFGAYVKLYGYFIYYFERLRPAGTSLWNETEEMMGALYLDFGLYLTAKFKAQVFLNAIKYEPTLYDKEWSLLTVGDRQSVYGFAMEPTEDDVLYIWDEDADSTNGITMAIPDSHLTMKQIDLTTGAKTQSPYDLDRFLVTFDNEWFRLDNNGRICVDVPEGTRYLSGTMRIVWKGGKLSFSKYDVDLTVPVVWTNMSQSELDARYTASVAVGNTTTGYQTVWSGRYSKLDVFDLPTYDEILDLIDYDTYQAEDGTNLKYAAVSGYTEASTGLQLKTDRTFFFDVTPQTYTLTVTGVQKADGTTETRTYTARYGESFDLSDLAATGASDAASGTYTRFWNLTEPGAPDDADPLPLQIEAGLSYAQQYGTGGAVYEANYLSSALTATYNFLGLGNDVPPVTITFASGTRPSFPDIADYVRQYGGENASIVSIDPAQEASESSVTYTVVCQVDETRKPFTLSFDTQGGSAIDSQRYLEGSVIMQPDDPTRAGYTFAGWYTDKAGTTPFDFTAGMPGQDTTLYAKWTANTYTITFVTSTGTAPAAQTVQYGEPYGALPVLSDSTLRFMGWYTSETGGTQVTADTVFTSTSNQTLYARWEAKIAIDDSWITIEPRTENYDETEPGFPVTVTVNAPDGDLAPDDFAVTYLWEKAGSEWTSEAPSQGGSYLVTLTRPADDKYLAYSYTSSDPLVTVNRISMSSKTRLTSPTVSISNWTLTTDISRCQVKGDGQITYTLLYYIETDYNYTTLETGSTTGTFDLKKYNRGAGRYMVRIQVAQGTNYLAIESDAGGNSVDDNGNGLFSSSAPATLSAAPVIRPAARTAPLIASRSLTAEDGATMTLSPEEIEFRRGKEFEVTLALDKSVDVWGILTAVSYDTDTLELLGYSSGGLFTESQFTAQENMSASPYRVLATRDDTGTAPASGAFITLRFRVRDDAARESATISLQNLEVVGDGTHAAVKAGAAAQVASKATTDTGHSTTPESGSGEPSPGTGDTTRLVLWATLFAGCGGTLGILALRRKFRKRKNKTE